MYHIFFPASLLLFGFDLLDWDCTVYARENMGARVSSLPYYF